MSGLLKHGVLPGIGLRATLAGLSLWAMGLGGIVAGLAVAVIAGWLARRTGGREDGQLAGKYLLALAAVVALISTRHSIDLTHLVFGDVLAADSPPLFGMAAVVTVTLPVLALIWRPLVLGSFEPGFIAATRGQGGVWHLILLALAGLCVVSGFAALGTPKSVGSMMPPAIAERHWTASQDGQVRAAVALACVASFGGLVLSYDVDLTAGSAIGLTAGGFWLNSSPHTSQWRQVISDV